MARLDVKTQDPERYAQVKAEQEELKLQFSMAAFGTSVARLCPYCEHNQLEAAPGRSAAQRGYKSGMSA